MVHLKFHLNSGKYGLLMVHDHHQLYYSRYALSNYIVYIIELHIYMTYMCISVHASEIKFGLYHENGWILSKYSLNVADINAPIKYFLGFDLIDKKFTIKETNYRKS